ncbi:MAG: prolipoprotein diacylglyceryl transferase [Akkermansia sp.]|nr:prolipoprotein diacylglyceryl transferase [Akkermansia sp.]
MNTLATYIHHIDPILLDIPGTPLAIRWYGLAYVGGFILGYMVLLWLAKRRLYTVEPEKLGDFITTVCIFGVLMGGRLGEFFFYWLPEHGWSGFCNDPLWVLRVWEGGMASHGGIIAVLLVTIWYCRKNKLSIPSVTDGLAIVCTIGIFFGRVANFINGELYGRITTATNPIAMKFPQEFFALPTTTQIQAKAALDHTMGAPIETLAICDNAGMPTESFFDIMMRLTRENDSFRETLGQFLTPRYPSQLFEALGEGLIIFIVLIALRLGWKNAPSGIFSALFCFMYATARISTECFREPDADTWHGITRGQYLSFAIVALGVAFLIPALRKLKMQKN